MSAEQGEVQVSEVALERRRTVWTVIGGAFLAIAGVVILANAIVATTVSVYFLGWMALISGVVLVIAALARIKSGGFWSVALGGAILVVLGLFLLRNPGAAALTLTILAGSLFLVGGLTRLVVAIQIGREGRWLLVVSGVISIILGLWVLFNLSEATLALLGILLGVQALVEGLTLIVSGRLRFVTS